MDRRGCLRACAALAVVPVSTWSACVRAAADAQAGEIRRQLRFTLTLINPRAAQLTGQTLWLYLPANETGTQRLLQTRVSASHEVLHDPLGHTLLELRFAQFAPLAQKTISVAAEVAMRSKPGESPLADPRAWLAAERYIETDDARIRTLAFELRRATPLQTAKAIYDWVKLNMNYAGYVADDLGALQALLERRGDCTEYAYLAVALARVCGIPARMVGGYFADRDVAPRPEEYHNWAELYIDGAWRLLDAQKENWLAPAEDYVAFRFYRDQPINPIGRAHRFRMEGELQVRL